MEPAPQYSYLWARKYSLMTRSFLVWIVILDTDFPPLPGKNAGMSPLKRDPSKKRLTVDLPVETYRALKVHCARNDTNMADRLRELIGGLLAAEAEGQPELPSRRPAVPSRRPA